MDWSQMIALAALAVCCVALIVDTRGLRRRVERLEGERPDPPIPGYGYGEYLEGAAAAARERELGAWIDEDGRVRYD